MRTPVGAEQPPALICRVFDDDMMGKDFLGEVSGHNLCRPCVHSQDRLDLDNPVTYSYSLCLGEMS